MPVIIIGTNTGDDLAGAEDCNIKFGAPNTNYNNGAYSYIYESPGEMERYLIGFSSLDTLDDSTVNDADLWMRSLSYSSPVIEARPLLVPFIESQATWNDRVTSTGWDTAGVDITGTDSRATVSFSSAGSSEGGGYYSFTSAQFIADIEDQIDGTISNYGFILRENDTSGEFQFESFGDGSRTYLVLDYTVSGGDDLTSSDGLELSDSAGMTAAASMSCSDTLELSSVSGLTAAGNMTTNDGLVLTETIGNTISALMNLSDTVEFSETAQNTAALLMSLIDNPIFSDQVSLQSGNFMNSADAVEFSESFSADTGVLTLTVNDGVTFSDAVNQVVSAVMGIEEGLILSDTASLLTGDFVEGPIKISVQVKQSTFDIVIKKSGFSTVSKQSKFDTEIN